MLLPSLFSGRLPLQTLHYSGATAVVVDGKTNILMSRNDSGSLLFIRFLFFPLLLFYETVANHSEEPRPDKECPLVVILCNARPKAKPLIDKYIHFSDQIIPNVFVNIN